MQGTTEWLQGEASFWSWNSCFGTVIVLYLFVLVALQSVLVVLRLLYMCIRPFVVYQLWIVMYELFRKAVFQGLFYYLEYHKSIIFRDLPEGFNEYGTIETITEVVERILECINFISLESIFPYQSKLSRMCCLDVFWIPEPKAIMNTI